MTNTNLEIIIDEIEKLESQPMSYSVADKLATLYIVRDHSLPKESFPKGITPELNGNEFFEAVSNVDITELLDVLNEHMTVVQLLLPKEYEALVQKIKDLK